jgi:hypothetical protein
MQGASVKITEGECVRFSETLEPINETVYKRFNAKRVALMKIQAF